MLIKLALTYCLISRVWIFKLNFLFISFPPGSRHQIHCQVDVSFAYICNIICAKACSQSSKCHVHEQIEFAKKLELRWKNLVQVNCDAYQTLNEILLIFLIGGPCQISSCHFSSMVEFRNRILHIELFIISNYRHPVFVSINYMGTNTCCCNRFQSKIDKIHMGISNIHIISCGHFEPINLY